MKFFIISSFFNLLTSTICCIFIALSKNKTKTSKTFFIFSISTLIWSFFYCLWIVNSSKESALFYSRLLNYGALFIPISFFHFCCHLLNQFEKFRKIIRCTYLFNILFLPIALSPAYIATVRNISIFKYWPQPGPFFIILILEYLVLVGLALIEISQEIRNSKEIKEKTMLRFVHRGLVIGFLGGATNFPFCYNIPIPPIGNALVSFYTFGVMYSIFKYQFMDISIVLKRSLIYTILISLITLFYLISIYVLENIFKELLGYKSFFFSLASATIIAAVFIPLKNLIQNFVEKTLFRGSYIQIAEENELLRQEVMQTERLKSVAILASGMAHEIKNPLTVLKTFSEYLPKKLDDKAFLTKFAPMITQEVNRIDHLVHELLDFARPAQPILKPTNLHDLLNSVLELLSNDYLKHHVKIEKNYQLDNSTTLALDQNQIRQALLNIFLNAIDAMPKGGYLSITTSLIDIDKIRIKIQDTGIGIDSNDLQHIFDPFFTKKDGGTGLGLSITFEIIKKHGGKIFVESVPTKGTSFIIELPTTTHPS